MSDRPAETAHGRLLAGEVGELAGVSGTTIGQWARWGYIRSSQSDGEPRVYSVEDVAEAAVVSELLARGVRHRDIRVVLERLGPAYGPWPLSEARLATTDGDRRPHVVLRDNGTVFDLSAAGWQATTGAERLEDVRLRLRRARWRPARATIRT